MKDFFISYHSADIDWAEWIISLLVDSGYVISSRAIDSQLHNGFIYELKDGSRFAKRVILLLSPSFLDLHFSLQEWTRAFEPSNELSKLILPVNIKNCFIDLLLPQIHYVDLVSLELSKAKNLLLREVGVFIHAPKSISHYDKSGRQNMIVGLPRVWNVPFFRDHYFTGRERDLIKIRKMLTRNNHGRSVKILHGLSGVGKTSLAVEYANRYSGDYSVIWWVRSENMITLMNDLTDLSKRLGLSCFDNVEQESALENLFKGLENNSDWLLIFDNSDNPDDIKKIVPEKINGHILITSRNSEWGEETNNIQVSVLNRSESLELIHNLTDQTDYENSNKLAEELSDLPLALTQVCAYINNKRISIKDYLNILQNYQQDFSEHVITNSNYPRTIKASMEITFRQVQNISESAVNLMNFCAFLASEDIPIMEFCKKSNRFPEKLATWMSDPLKLNELLKILEKYSLVKVDKDSISIHRLVQTMIMETLDSDSKEGWRTTALRAVNETFDFDKDDVKSWEKCSRLLPHAVAILRHPGIKGGDTSETGELMNKLGDLMLNKCSYQDARNFLKKALKIYKAIYGKNHPKLADTYHSIGLINQELGQYSKAKRYFDLALSIDKKNSISKNPKVSRDLNSIGNVLLSLNKLDGAYHYFKEALMLNVEVYGESHNEVAKNLNNLGVVSKYLNNHEQSIEYLNHAL
ncbi:tetratricopeptide repeat protein, partial [bacterium]|nr:tetratricopeptide repeat protein [bacterium]